MKRFNFLDTLLVAVTCLISTGTNAQQAAFPSRLSQMSDAQFAQWLVGTEWEYDPSGNTRVYWFLAPDLTAWKTLKRGNEPAGFLYTITSKGGAAWRSSSKAVSFKVDETLDRATITSGDDTHRAKLIARRMPAPVPGMSIAQFEARMQGRMFQGNDGHLLEWGTEKEWVHFTRARSKISERLGLTILQPGLFRVGRSIYIMSTDLQTYEKLHEDGHAIGTVRDSSTKPAPAVVEKSPERQNPGAAPFSMNDAAPATLKLTSASLNGLMVVDLGNSRYAGKASKLSISALKLQTNKAATLSFNQEVGPMMEKALSEVARFHALRHGGWPQGYQIELAFADKYSPKDGPSAAVACALNLESLFSGVPLDPAFAVTGDLNADGSVQPIGGVTAKLRGATKSGMNLVAIPEKNRISTLDLAVSEGIAPFLGAQVFSIATFDSALALARKNKEPAVMLSMAQYAQICEDIRRNPAALRSPGTMGILTEISTRTPDHVGARLLLAMAQNTLPQRLSAAGSVEAVDQSVASVVEAAKSDVRSSSSLDAGQVGAAKGRLQRLRTLVDQRVQPYVDAWMEWTRLADVYIARRSSSGPVVDQLKQAGLKIDAELAKLQGNAEFTEELMR